MKGGNFMGIVWFNERPKDGIATLYEGNITLNKVAIENLEDAFSVMLGIDYDKKLVYIKPLSKDQDQRGDIPEKSKYKITIRSSYGRISNKDFMQELSSIMNRNLKNPVKCVTTWDFDEKVLIIDLSNIKEGE